MTWGAGLGRGKSSKIYFISKLLYLPGADMEKIEPGGANSINDQTEPGEGAQIYFHLSYI